MIRLELMLRNGIELGGDDDFYPIQTPVEI